MKRISILTISILALLAILCTVYPSRIGLAQTQQPTPSALQSTARQVVDLLVQGQYDKVIQYFDPELTNQLNKDKLQQAGESLAKQLGAYKQITDIYQIHKGNLDQVYVTTEFANSSVDILITFNEAGKIIGLVFQPAGMGKAATQPYKTAPYAKPGSFTEQQVMVGAPGYELPGILTIPNGQGPFPAVVLVHGSGPNDMDETIYTNKPFRDLAEGLASQGIAVLRYDKRTKVYGQQIAEHPENITVKEEVTDDAISALELLHKTPGIDPQRIYLLGHSLGGMLVPRIADQVKTMPEASIAGAIVMAGPTRPLEDIVIEQFTYLYGLAGTPSPTQQAAIEQLKQQAAKAKDPNLALDTPLDQLPLSLPASYWKDLQGYKPAETAATLSIPMLILRGERDYQVAQADFDGWNATLGNKPGVILKEYPGLNHQFLYGTGQPNPQEYLKTGHVSEQVVKDIASFIKTGKVSQGIPFIGSLSIQDITRLLLLLLPIYLIQIGLSIYALIDLIRRKKTNGPRWMWAVFLVLTLFALPSGLIVAGLYLFIGRKDEELEDGEYDTN